MAWTTTTGPITIRFDVIWWEAFAREWADLGELAHRRENRLHIGTHDNMWLQTNDGCCCFECRVQRAWQEAHRYRPPPSRKEMRRAFMARKKRRGWA